MKILFDLNVLIDVACRWEAFPESYALYKRTTASAAHQGCFPACGYTTLYYVIGQLISEQRTRAVLGEFRNRLSMLPFNGKLAAGAHLLQMGDLEDACVAATAFEGRCDVIATRNVADFKVSPILAKTPGELLAQLGET